MADKDDNQDTGPGPGSSFEVQDQLASLDNGGTMPMSPPSDAMAITNEAANIARELRTLAHRVESFKIKFAR